MRWGIGIGLICAVSAASGATPEQIRDAVAKAVRVIQTSQKSWAAKQQCASCHHSNLPAMAMQATREHGIPVDQAVLHESLVHTFRMYSNLDRAVQYTHIIDPAADDGARLAVGPAAGLRPNLVTAVYARHLAQRQMPAGHWQGLDNRPPQSHSPFSATALSLRAIQLYGHPSLAADTKARVEKARAWLDSNQPGNTEDRAYQLFGLLWAGAGNGRRTALAKQLIATQQSDGGWKSIEGRASDAYSTGTALMALHDAGGVAITDPAWLRGLDFLLKTQAPDGTWHVESRLHPPAQVSPPYFETGHPYGHDQFISMMGDCWAVTALATALGPATPKEIPELTEAAPVGVEPWAETILFGTVDQVRALLDKKFDPNSATKSGGTTALMLAMPDLEKATLLLDRGAKINARSKTRYSALLVAAQYPHASPVMRMLLARRAEINLPKGAGLPLFGMYPVATATIAGNAEIIPALKAAGDKIDAGVLLLGQGPITPLVYAVSFEDSRVVEALLAAGAKLEQTDDDGLTPLNWAAIGNRVETARALIARGANVNHADKKGYTPLHYAASIDYGDSAMVELLLKSGAKSDLKTGEGATAAQLAGKYGHHALIAALGAGAKRAGL
ncbi:MAG TPA: ankyrin repeat domain-containing protein [Bryobacteraceae bacterium]|jgi:ankyrin repeat protein|nr:ankyrin repeat domain-containing protein [Bryobacteraceae bacterium]